MSTVHHCVTFAIEYLGHRLKQRLGSKGLGNGLRESNGHVTNDVTWPRKVELVTPIRLKSNISENSWRCYLATIA